MDKADPKGEKGCAGDLVLTVCETDRASGGSGRHNEPERQPTAKEIKDSGTVAAIVLAAPIVVAAVVIAAPEIATVVARSAAAKATKEFAKSVTKDAVKKTLAVGMNATLEVQGSLVNAERLTGTAAAVVEENSMGSALSKEFETMMNVVLKTMK